MIAAEASSLRFMTPEQWGDLAEDEPGELVNGIIEEEEMPTLIHEIVVKWILLALDAFFAGRGGLVVGSGLKLAVRPDSGRVPDVSCFGAGKKPEPRGVVHVPPDIVVEVVSADPSDQRRDRVQKPDDYAAFGVRWYWLVDPELRSFEVWELGGDGRYVRAVSAIDGKVDRVPGCEGLIIDLDALWAELDRRLG
jgi:Uma2 family endonuclease